MLLTGVPARGILSAPRRPVRLRARAARVVATKEVPLWMPVEVELKGRDREIEIARELLTEKPTGILYLNGPKNAGKTAIFRSMLLELSNKGHPVICLDGRSGQFETPEKFIKAFLPEMYSAFGESTDNFIAFTKKMASSMAGAAKVSVGTESSSGQFDFAKFAEEIMADTSSPLEKLVAEFNRLAVKKRKFGPRGEVLLPIVMLDDFSAAKYWDAASLNRLLTFFVMATKQNGRAIVLLTTSEYFFIKVLQSSGFQTEHLEQMTLGNLGIKEARVLFDHRLLEVDPKEEKLSRTFDWERIYQLTWGNPLAIYSLINSAKRYRSWDEAITARIKQLGSRLELGVQPGNGGASRPEHFKQIVRALVDAGGFLPADAMPSGVTKEILIAFVEEQLLGVRVVGPLSTDVPMDAFTGTNDMVFTFADMGMMLPAKALVAEGKF